jgi:hypothetical protein
LYRSHLANVYRFLNLAPPEELSRPILKIASPDVRIAPTGPIQPVIDGEVTSYFEWLGAGLYQVDERSGSMHGKKFLVKEVLFGSDGERLYVRVDFRPGVEADLAGMEARVAVQSLESTPPYHVTIRFQNGQACTGDAVKCAYRHVLETCFDLEAIGVKPGAGVRFQLSLWSAGLPVDAVPQQGWLEMTTTDRLEMAG